MTDILPVNGFGGGEGGWGSAAGAFAGALFGSWFGDWGGNGRGGVRNGGASPQSDNERGTDEIYTLQSTLERHSAYRKDAGRQTRNMGKIRTSRRRAP